MAVLIAFKEVTQITMLALQDFHHNLRSLPDLLNEMKLLGLKGNNRYLLVKAFEFSLNSRICY